MTRESIPKKTRDTLLNEYSHRCAICGGNDPHIHHIDEDHSNNLVENLLPLCPNCHLRDQHNPTRKIDVSKLKLFRRYKDPTILKPQFHPIYLRQIFLDSVESGEADVKELGYKANELVEFIKAFEMGKFYAKQIDELLELRYPSTVSFSDDSESFYESQSRNINRAYREKLIANREAVQRLIIEQLRYQKWAHES